MLQYFRTTGRVSRRDEGQAIMAHGRIILFGGTFGCKIPLHPVMSVEFSAKRETPITTASVTSYEAGATRCWAAGSSLPDASQGHLLTVGRKIQRSGTPSSSSPVRRNDRPVGRFLAHRDVWHARRRELGDDTGVQSSVLIPVFGSEIINLGGVCGVRRTPASERTQAVLALCSRPHCRIASGRAIATSR